MNVCVPGLNFTRVDASHGNALPSRVQLNVDPLTVEPSLKVTFRVMTKERSLGPVRIVVSGAATGPV